MFLLLFNAGVPMLFPTMFLMIVALVPIIIFESLYVSNSLSLSFWNVLKSVGLANIFSTLVGIPLTWLFLVILSVITGGGRIYQLNSSLKKMLIVIYQSAWLAPYGRNLRWMVPAACLVLLIPFFFVSWFSENWIISYFLENTDKTNINHSIRNANLLSYSMLATYLLIKLLREKYKLSKMMSNKHLENRRKLRLKKITT